MQSPKRKPSGWTTMLLFSLVFAVTSTALVGLAALGKDGYYLGILVVLAASVGVVWYALGVMGDQDRRKRYTAWRAGALPQPAAVVKRRAQFSVRSLLALTVAAALLLAAIRTHGTAHLLVLLIPIATCGLIGAFENPFPNLRMGPLRGRSMNGALGGAAGGLLAACLTMSAGVYTHYLALFSLRSAYLLAWWTYWGAFAGCVMGLLAAAGDYSRAPQQFTSDPQLPRDLEVVDVDGPFTADAIEG